VTQIYLDANVLETVEDRRSVTMGHAPVGNSIGLLLIEWS